jgi:adenylate cyclase
MSWLGGVKVWTRGGLLGLVVATALVFGLLERLELWTFNFQFQLRGPRPPQTPIVIVTINEDSFDELNLAWPWPRALHGKLLELLNRGKPAAVGLDILFTEPASRGPADDRALAQGVGRAGNVVLAAAHTRVEESFFIKESLNPPLKLIRDHAVGFGFVNFDSDDDAFVRSAALTRSYQGAEIPSFDLQLYGLGVKAGIPAKPLPTQQRVLINYRGPFLAAWVTCLQQRAPSNAGWGGLVGFVNAVKSAGLVNAITALATCHVPQRVLINYRGGPRTFPAVPYYRIITGEVSPEEFLGKIVMVGATSPTLHDIFPTPFAPQGDMPGVEIHASMLETLFQGIQLTRIPTWTLVGLVLGASVCAVWVTNRLRPLVAFGVLTVVGLACAGASLAAFAWGYLWIDQIPVQSALMLGYGITVVENFIKEQREKRRLSRFFSPNVLREVVRHRDELALGSSRRRITVLFSDIRGFTSISEKLSPEEVAELLREYLTRLTEAVFKHGGAVDKYIGDAVMALYNAPFDQPDHAVQAVRTALEFQEIVRELSARWLAKCGSDLKNGVGISTGDAVVGTLGSAQRLEYTAVGDAVNVASRLEGLTKDFATPIIISEPTYQEVKQIFAGRYLGEVTVKGKEVPVKIYGVEREEVRRASRVRVEVPLTITEAEVSVPAAVSDLSLTGLAAKNVPRQLPRGQVVQLRLDLPELSRPMSAEGRVMWNEEDRAGIMFLNLPDEEKQLLETFLGSGRWTQEG